MDSRLSNPWYLICYSSVIKCCNLSCIKDTKRKNMGKLLVYNFVSANGYFKGPNEDISWAHQNPSQEEKDFAAENAQGGAILLFGRKTYEMMAGYWPSADAKKNNAGVADGMNKAEKIVFSKTLKKADWNNTRVVSGNIEEEVRKLKRWEKEKKE